MRTPRSRDARRGVRVGHTPKGGRLCLVHFLGVIILKHALVNTRYHRTQLLARLEHGHWTRRNLNGRAGARIPGHPGFALADLVRAEPTHFNVLLFLQRFLYCVKERVNDARTILLGDGRPGRLRNTRRDVLNQIGFRHGLYQRVDVPSQFLGTSGTQRMSSEGCERMTLVLISQAFGSLHT